jgi:hypothetical protein
MSNKSNPSVATMGIDIGKNSFHVVGLDQRGAIMLRQKWSRGQIEARLANRQQAFMQIRVLDQLEPMASRIANRGHV